MSDFKERKKKELERLKDLAIGRLEVNDSVGFAIAKANFDAVLHATEPVDDGKTFFLEDPREGL